MDVQDPGNGGYAPKGGGVDSHGTRAGHRLCLQDLSGREMV